MSNEYDELLARLELFCVKEHVNLTINICSSDDANNSRIVTNIKY